MDNEKTESGIEDTPPTSWPPEEGLKYGDLNSRMLALAIDMTFIWMTLIQLAFFIAPGFYGSINLERLNELEHLWSMQSVLFFTGQPYEYTPMEVYQMMIAEGMLWKWFVDSTVQAVLVATTMIFFWERFGTTPGKWLLRLQIVDAQTGAKPRRKQAIKRFLFGLVSIGALMLGYVALHFSKTKQTWHDRFAGTLVIKKIKKKRQKAVE